MALDILGAFRRMITLPAAHNSLSDILGKDAAHVVTQTFHGLVADAVLSALHVAVVTGEDDLNKVGSAVTAAVDAVLKGVTPALAGEIELRIRDGLIHGEQLVEASLPAVAEGLVGSIAKLLKLTEA